MDPFMAAPNRNIIFDKATGRWRVKIVRDKKTAFTGRFDTIEEARAARDAFNDPWKEALDIRAALVPIQSPTGNARKRPRAGAIEIAQLYAAQRALPSEPTDDPAHADIA